MNRETSIYLDLTRFVAALTVFLGHVSGQRLTGGFLWQFGPFMAEAVAIFFVLSGFVIGYVADSKENTPSVFAINRAARILSVTAPTLAITFALDTLGRTLRPDLYNASWGYDPQGQAWSFLACLFFINELWTNRIHPGSALPYWSLGYEVWYYITFALAVFTRRRVAWVALALMVVGPKIAAMFPLWLLGLGTYRLSQRMSLARSTGIAIWLGSILLWIGYEMFLRPRGWLQGWGPSFIERPEILTDYIPGLCFATNLVGFIAASPWLGRPLLGLARPIRWAAGATFTLYLMHLPIAQFLTTVVPWPPTAWATRVTIPLLTLTLVFLVAAVTERKKEAWRRAIAKLVDLAFTRQPAPRGLS